MTNELPPVPTIDVLMRWVDQALGDLPDSKIMRTSEAQDVLLDLRNAIKREMA